MDHLCLVLVAPQGARNVGAVCRVMANFGVDDLRLVNPCHDYRGAEARRMALKARHLLETARRCGRLDEALADRHLVIGATARRGKYRDRCLTPRQLTREVAERAATTRVALVLGTEDSGLSRAEIDMCDTLVSIPTAGSYTSLNLAQAAGLLLYELHLAQHPDSAPSPGPSSEQVPLADHDQLERLYRHMRATLTHSGFLPPDNPDHLMRSFRRLFGRAALDEREVRILRGVLSSVDALMDEP